MSKHPLRKEVEDVVLGIIANSTDIAISEIHMEDDLIADLDMDSLSIFEVAIDLEEHYGVQMEDEVLDHIHTVDDICQYIVHEHEKREGI